MPASGASTAATAATVAIAAPAATAATASVLFGPARERPGMVELLTLVALALLVGGIAGSFLPLLPSGLLALAGVYVHYFGVTDPGFGILLLVSFTLVGLFAAALEQFGGAFASKAGGASTGTALLAAVVGVALLFVLGPVGVLVGVVGVVLVAELARGEDPEQALRAGTYTAVGMLASSLAQAAITLSMLAAFVLFVFVI